MADHTGTRFGNLMVMGPSKYINGKGKSKCRCICGKELFVRTDLLKNGRRKSCGCTHYTSLPSYHGHVGTPTHMSWEAMKQRCHDTNAANYSSYGGKGVIVCDRWRESFLNFLEDVGERPPGTSLDRYPNRNGNYDPTNWRWATPAQQRRNTNQYDLRYLRGLIIRDQHQEGMTIPELSEFFGLHKRTIRDIINYKTLTIPPGQ